MRAMRRYAPMPSRSRGLPASSRFTTVPNGTRSSGCSTCNTACAGAASGSGSNDCCLTSRPGPAWCGPDLLLDLRDFTTGEVMEAALEVVTAAGADTLGLKLRQVETLRQIAPVVTIHAEDLEGDAREGAVLDQLHIG